MKTLLYIFSLTGAVLGALVLAGCARFPETAGPGDTPPKTLLAQVTVAGQINPTYYYHLALDTDGNSTDGPVPVVTGPELGNGWGILSDLGPNNQPKEPPFYVRYHNGTFEQFLNGQPLGPPFRSEVSSDGKTLSVEIDTRLLNLGTVNQVELNWITDTDITTNPSDPFTPKEYDGFGPTGNDYFEVPLGVQNTWISGQNGIPEELPGDTTTVDDIDEIGWRVEVRINSQVTP